MSTPSTVIFPLDSFREAAPHLRRPFTPEAVRFKVQATYKENTGALIVAYIDARLAVERLNLIVPHLWHDYYEQDGQGYKCVLTVDGLSRQDTGDGLGKGGYSDALKRAAVKFGIGVSLYAIPQTHLSADRQELRPVKTSKGMSLVMTAKGEQAARSRYREWLTAIGTEAFGEPLSHGDVEGAQGDAEAEEPTPVVETAPVALPQSSVDEVLAAIKHAKPDPEAVREKLIDLGVNRVPQGALKVSTLRALTPAQAAEMVLWLSAGAEVLDAGE